MKKSENTIAFFPILKDGAKHYKRYLGLNPPFNLIVHTGTAGTGSNILNTNHMFPNPAGPFPYPLPLYVCRVGIISIDVWFSEGLIHRCFLYARAHGCRLPRTIQKTIALYCGKGARVKTKNTRPMKLKRGRAIYSIRCNHTESILLKAYF